MFRSEYQLSLPLQTDFHEPLPQPDLVYDEVFAGMLLSNNWRTKDVRLDCYPK